MWKIVWTQDCGQLPKGLDAVDRQAILLYHPFKQDTQELVASKSFQVKRLWV